MQKYSFQSIGAFDAQAYDLEGPILFETMLIMRAVDWLAKLSIDPNTEIRRGTLAVFSELQATYSSQRTLHELISIITMTRSFLKREFVAPCLTWENGSRKWPSLPQAVQFKSGRISPLNCSPSLLS
jgi:hypothetical protein